jgi:tetratricopeptide (TPR) repeat protein
VLRYEIDFETRATGWPPQLEQHKSELEALKHEGPLSEYIATLETLISEFPDARILYTWLAQAYGKDSQPEKTAELSKQTFERFPDYIFALVNYVLICVQQGNLEQAEAALGGHSDLTSFCGGKVEFHVSEVVAFHSCLATLMGAKGEYRRMEDHLELALQVVPEHPSLMRVIAQHNQHLSSEFLAKIIPRVAQYRASL